ncbi:hypothetical protein ACLKA6_002996 [Drosophila palustris]
MSHQQQQRKGSSSKRPSTRLPFHPRRTPRKQPRLQLEEQDTTSMTDVLELTASPITDPAIEAVMTPPPTVSPEVAGAKFCWPEPQPKSPQQQPTTPPLPAQPTPPLPAQPTSQAPTQLLTLPTAQPIVRLRALPAVRPLAHPATRPRASRSRKPIRPIRPLTPTIITILDSDEEPARSRYDPVVQREVPIKTGPGAVAGGASAAAAAAATTGSKTVRRAYRGGMAERGHSSILAAAGSSLQSLLCQDIHQSLLLRDQAYSPCSARTFINPCCCGIQPTVLALSGHSSILAAAGSNLQSLLCQDIHQSLLLRDPAYSPCSVRTLIDPCCCGIKSSVLTLAGHSSIFAAAGSSHQSLRRQDIHQSLLLRDPVISP